MTTTLRAKNKLGFINGSLAKPIVKEDDTFVLQVWEMVNSMVSSWSLNVVHPRLRTSVAYTNTGKAMWETLRKHYAIDNALQIHQLKTSIANCNQGGLSVVEFYAKIKDLWVELENHYKIPLCTFTRCTYGATNKIVQNMNKRSHINS